MDSLRGRIFHQNLAGARVLDTEADYAAVASAEAIRCRRYSGVEGRRWLDYSMERLAVAGVAGAAAAGGGHICDSTSSFMVVDKHIIPQVLSARGGDLALDGLIERARAASHLGRQGCVV